MADMGLSKRNSVFQYNDGSVSGSYAGIEITANGSDWYFTVCSIMGVATFAFLGLGLRVPRERRIFHYITAAVTMVATIAYFSMGSNLGWTGITVEFHRPKGSQVYGNVREIFYVRYIDWFVTTPLLLMDLLLTAGLPWPTILFVIVCDEVMVVTGLVGALTATRYKWGYFAFGCAALCYIFYVLVWEGRRNAQALGKDIGRVFLICGSLTALLWWLYPISWAICEGGNEITPDAEAIFYGILDVFAKPVFGALLIWGHKDIDPARLGLSLHDYVNDFNIKDGEKTKKREDGAIDGPLENGNNRGVETNGNTGVVTGNHNGTETV